MRTSPERIADVRRLLDAARRVAADPSIVVPLMESTSLSREGVELGLSRHLETDATDEQLAALVKAAGDAPSVHVILSANVFVAPLRALALALSASEKVTVKPSRREPHFTRALIAALDDPRVAMTTMHPAEIAQGEIHVYGRDETITSVRAAAPAGVRVRGHGSGMGVAVVAGDLAQAASRLAEDVVAFDQRGCLSPRVAFVVGDGMAFAHALRDALERRSKEIPRGRLEQSEATDLAWWASTVSYAGTFLAGDSCAVGVMNELTLPPTGRHVLVVPIAAIREMPAKLDWAARFTVTVGCDVDPELVRDVAPAHARIARLGEMQRPPLDGPVDRR